MGAVWRATDELLNRTVAAKELLAAAVPATEPPAQGLEESRQRLMREGRIGARLNHPHVISMFDVVVHEDRPWLVMEYLPSKSLSTVIAEKGPLAPVQVADIGRQIADGLAAAHLAGVVHRDIKPGNVLLAEDGRVKITDFGVSRAVDDVQLTRTGLIAGTPAFLSPEVAQGREPAAASDVFALGATLYAAVEGQPPFGLDDNPYALLHRVAGGVVDPPQQAGPIAGILGWLLRPDPADRPSAAQARDALAAIAAGQLPPGRAPSMDLFAAVAPQARPAPRPAPPPPAERRGRSPALLVLLAMLIIAGVVIAAVLVNNATTSTGADPQALPPETTSQAPPPTSARPTQSATPTPTPTTTPTTTPAPGIDDPVGFLQGYYALLPGDTDAAYALLSPEAQSASGGRAGFDAFYAAMESVSLQDVRQVGDVTVEATVVFDRRNGATTNEPYRFVMATDGDRTIMQSFTKR